MAGKKKATEDRETALSPAETKARDEKLLKRGYGPSLTDRAEIMPWEVGMEIEGTFVRAKKLPDRANKTGGHIFLIDTHEGRMCYGAPTILWEVMEHWTGGEEVLILCTGTVPTTRGNDAWTFDVRVKK